MSNWSGLDVSWDIWHHMSQGSKTVQNDEHCDLEMAMGGNDNDNTTQLLFCCGTNPNYHLAGASAGAIQIIAATEGILSVSVMLNEVKSSRWTTTCLCPVEWIRITDKAMAWFKNKDSMADHLLVSNSPSDLGTAGMNQWAISLCHKCCCTMSFAMLLFVWLASFVCQFYLTPAQSSKCNDIVPELIMSQNWANSDDVTQRSTHRNTKNIRIICIFLIVHWLCLIRVPIACLWCRF